MNGRKIISLLVVCFSFAFLSSQANASLLTGWTFDVTGLGGNAAINDISSASFDNAGTDSTIIRQSLGTNGVLGNGDTFTESVVMKLSSFTAGGANVNSANATDLGNSVYLAAQGITGHIEDFNNHGTPLDPTDDTYKYVFDAGSGTVGMYFDTNANLTSFISNLTYSGGTGTLGTDIMDLALVPLSSGTADGYLGGSDPQSNYSVSLKVTGALSGVFTDGSGNDLTGLFPNLLFASETGTASIVTSETTTGTDTNGIGYLQFKGQTGDLFKLQVVPEPSTMTLFGIGLLGIALSGRKLKSKI
jgi:hypothetical protein